VYSKFLRIYMKHTKGCGNVRARQNISTNSAEGVRTRLMQAGTDLCRFTTIAESSAASTRSQEPTGPPAAAAAGSDVYGEPVTFIGR